MIHFFMIIDEYNILKYMYLKQKTCFNIIHVFTVTFDQF